MIVIAINCHQPDLPTSCRRLAPTAIEGKKQAATAIQYITPFPEVSPIEASQILPPSSSIVAKRKNHQYSEREPLPLKLK